jgi:serine/threonine protein kinase
MLRYKSHDGFFFRAKEDPRSDLFSLGVVLYEIATGCGLLWGWQPGESMEQMIARQSEALIRLYAKVPAGLARIIQRCLQDDLERRYQSASDLAADLKAFVANMRT